MPFTVIFFLNDILYKVHFCRPLDALALVPQKAELDIEAFVLLLY